MEFLQLLRQWTASSSCESLVQYETVSVQKTETRVVVINLLTNLVTVASGAWEFYFNSKNYHKLSVQVQRIFYRLCLKNRPHITFVCDSLKYRTDLNYFCTQNFTQVIMNLSIII